MGGLLARALGERPAALADQKGGVVGRAGLHAGGKGIEPADAVHQPLGHQKIERPVGHGRLGAKALGGKAFEHLIGAQRTMGLKQDLKGAPAHGREPAPAFGNHRLGPLHDRAAAGGVIVRAEGQRGFGAFGRGWGLGFSGGHCGRPLDM